MRSQDLLAALDSSAREFDFPVLDNANLDIADIRLTVLANDHDWVVVFEDLAWSEKELEFVNGIYAYGTCMQKPGFQGELIPIRQNPAEPIRDNDGRAVADPSRWSVIVGEKALEFEPTAEEYRKAGITVQGRVGEAAILRFLVHAMGHVFFASEDELRRFLPNCIGLKKILQTTVWQHPDVAGSELPSESVSMKSLAEVIEKQRPDLFDVGKPNTDWRIWQQR